MTRLPRIDAEWGLTVMRVAMAIVILVTGYQKLVGGMDRVTDIMVRDGIPLPGPSALLIIAMETLGGLLLLVGLGGRWLGLLYVVEFIVVTFYVQLPREGLMSARLPFLLLATGVMLAIAGSGRLALDNLIVRRLTGSTPLTGGRQPQIAGQAH